MGTNRHVLFSQTPFQKGVGRIDIKSEFIISLTYSILLFPVKNGVLGGF